jgi:hypothetical protein
MKIDEILLEYDRARAAQAVGPNLWKAMVRDIAQLKNVTLSNFEKDWETKYPISFLEWGTVLTDKASQEKLATNALEQLEKADPTSNKKYTQWLARMFASDPGTKLEDITSTAAEYLYKFNKLGLKKLLKPEHSDLNRFKDLKTFMDVLDQYELPEDESSKGKAKKVYADGDVTVIIPEDEPAACAYGRQTRWCTAATRGMNYFEHYSSQGPLYILIPKSPTHEGEKYQLHFPTGQFMNEDDEQQDIQWLLESRFPGLLNFFIEREQKYLQDLIQFAPNEVLKPILDRIAEIMIDEINDISAEWEINDDYFYKWLRDEGYVDDNDNIKDDAPSYFEYNDEAKRSYERMRDAVTLTPTQIKLLANDYKESEPDEPTEIGDIDMVMRWGFEHGSLEEGEAYRLDQYMGKRVQIFKNKEGQWTVQRIAER